MIQELLRRIQRKIPVFSYEKRFRFREVERGKLYRSSQPTREALRYFRTKYGIRALVIVLQTPEAYELAFAARHGMPVCHISLLRRAPCEDDARKFFDFVDNSAHQPALLHCAAGKDRTGCFSMLWRVERMGWDAKRAWEEMRMLGHCAFPWEPVYFSNFKKWLEQRYRTKLT